MIYLNIPLNTLSEVWAPLALGYLGGLLKIILQRNRFLGFLLVVEFTAVITITFLIIVVGKWIEVNCFSVLDLDKITGSNSYVLKVLIFYVILVLL